MTSKPPLIHYGLAPFKISVAPFKMLMRIFWVPDLLFIIRVGFIHMGKGLVFRPCKGETQRETVTDKGMERGV